MRKNAVMDCDIMKRLNIIILSMLFLALIVSGCIETLSNGKHAGQITSIEKEGLIWKTYTVYVKSDISSSQEDTYCVEDQGILPELYQASKDRAKITLLYRDEIIVAPWRCGSYNGGIITGIEK
jgi:hypothetical protein